MAEYTNSFEAAINHAMLYEVGGHWNVNAPGVKEGLISTQAQRKATGYVNDPTDMGGETKFGVARNANPDLNIVGLDWEAAKRVYYRRYWLASNCDDITLFASRLAVLHFDGAVNHGIGRAGKFLQRSVGADEDGDVGPATLRLLQAACMANGQVQLCHKICDYREKFYRDIVAAKPAQVKFLNGWLRRINEMRAFTTDESKSFL
jgi:lysozyme family protein